MIENIIGWTLILAVVLIPLYFVYKSVRAYREMRREHALAIEQAQAELQALKDREQERFRQDRLKRKTATPVASFEEPRKSTTYVAPRAADTDSGFVDAAMTALMITQLMQSSKESHASTVTHDYNTDTVTFTPVSTSSSSDDEDRRVVSDTFDSSSSWSSSDSSSSDSGPSSDW
jgi:hypothetical protein